VTLPADIRFHYRDGCHLCEEMAAALFRHWPAVAEAMTWVEVDALPELAQRYGDEVPVLCVGEETVCRHALDTGAVARYFGEPVNPV